MTGNSLALIASLLANRYTNKQGLKKNNSVIDTLNNITAVLFVIILGIFVVGWVIWKTYGFIFDLIKYIQSLFKKIILSFHNWGDWEYERGDSCRLVKYCRRCSKKIAGYIVHEWGDWEYENGSPCIQVRACRRCLKRDKKEGHDFEFSTTESGGWSSDSGWGLEYDVYTCKRCGHTKHSETREVPW